LGAFRYVKIAVLGSLSSNRLNSVMLDTQNNRTERLSSFSEKQAIFLDRDGVINQEAGYITKPDELKIINGVPEGIKKINDVGSLAIVVTNQSVIARGDCTEKELKNIHSRLERLLGKESAYVDAIYYCPHHPEFGKERKFRELKPGCSCRKPEPGLLKKAVKDMNISLKDSWLIGDTTTDILTAKRMGIKNILLRTGHAGQDHKYNAKPDYIFLGLNEAVDWILKEHEQAKSRAKKYINKVVGKKIIFIGGLARTGKSTWGQLIKELLVENNISASLINLDGWLLDEGKCKKEGSVLQRFDMDAIGNLLKKLDNQKRSLALDVPILKRSSGNQMEKSIRHNIDPTATVIIEGVPALCYENRQIKKCFNFYMECEEKTRKDRMMKDYCWKNIVGSEFESLYNSHKLDEKPIIEISKKNANAIINTS